MPTVDQPAAVSSWFWGTELGSRRDRALIAYDTDCDLMIRPSCMMMMLLLMMMMMTMMMMMMRMMMMPMMMR